MLMGLLNPGKLGKYYFDVQGMKYLNIRNSKTYFKCFDRDGISFVEFEV